MESRNCPNCGAPNDPHLNKCPYCGTSYFDLTAIDIADGKEDGIIQKDTFEKFDFDVSLLFEQRMKLRTVPSFNFL